MESKIASSILLKYQPVALIWSDEKRAEAVQFKEGKWGCIMWLAAGAAKGKTAVCDRKTFGCFGGGVGMGFGDQYVNFPGGKDCFCHWQCLKKWNTMLPAHFLNGPPGRV
jgi:hypothetical protein